MLKKSKKIILAVSICSALIIAASSFTTFASMTEIDFIGHRGYSSAYPENTIKAFSSACKNNFDGFELDVVEAYNGDLMIFHDDNTYRLCGKSKSIFKVNTSNRENYRIVNGNGNSGSGLLIPTLKESIKVAKKYNKDIYIHIKEADNYGGYLDVINLIEKYNIEEKAHIVTRSLTKVSLAADDGLSVGMWISTRSRSEANEKAAKSASRGADFLVIEDFILDRKKFGSDFVDYCHNLGLKVGVSTDTEYSSYVKMGVDFLVSGHELKSDFTSYIKNYTPTLKSVTSVSDGLRLKWKKVPGATGYRIYRKTAGGSYKAIKKVTGDTVTKYIDDTVKTGKKYRYYIKAYYEKKYSLKSNVIKATA